MRALSRGAILTESLGNCRAILVPDLATAVDVSNRYAPEHLIIQTREPRALLDEVVNAGSVFLGEWSPEPMGDYCSGTNHVLPTYGYARAYSGLSVLDFVKRITVQELTADGLRRLGPTAETLAHLEGLDAHALAVSGAARRARAAAAGMSWVTDLARPEIRALRPYQHAAWEPTLTRLHANELPWRVEGDSTDGGAEPLPGAAAARAGRRARASVWRAARAGAGRARQRRGHRPALPHLLPGRHRPGDRLSADVRHVCRGGTHPGRAGRDGAARCVPRASPSTSTAFSRAVDDRTRLVFVCSPNNPTGNCIDRTVLLDLADRLAPRALLVVDEAYVEFAGVASLAAEMRSHPNIVVLRTLSKSHGLAGARCGTLIAMPEIVALARKVIPPYAITELTVEVTAPLLVPDRDRVPWASGSACC